MDRLWGLGYNINNINLKLNIMLKKISLIILSLALVLGLSCCAVLAQEDVDTTADEAITNLVETAAGEEPEVEAEELEISEPGPFYWLKNFAWDVQAVFTRDPIKKSELKLKKASNQMLRARQLVERNPDDPRLQERLERINTNYQDIINRINERVEEFQVENPDAPQLKSFVDKYLNQQIRHQEILERLEEQVPAQVMERIRTNRQTHLQKFGEVMNKLQSREQIRERLRNILELPEQPAQVERRVRRMEIIEELGETNLPEIKARVQEFRQEQRATFQILKEKREELQEVRERAQEQLRETRQELREDIQNIRGIQQGATNNGGR